MKKGRPAVSEPSSRSTDAIGLASLGPARWNLPSGAGLGEFAMRSGFLAPRLLSRLRQSKPFGLAVSSELPPVAGIPGLLRGLDGRQFGDQEGTLSLPAGGAQRGAK